MKLWPLLERAAPWLILGLAGALRLGGLDLAAFTYDDADIVLRARAVAEGRPALTGPQTSWAVPDPPLLVYLAVLATPFPSPAFASLALFALLNTLTVVGTYLLGARFFGRAVGLSAALLFAVNPWAIYFGRRAWAEVQPGLTLLALWSALEVVSAARARFGLHFFLSLAAGVQVRLVSAALAPAALAALLLGGRRWLSRWSALGILGGVLISLPYAVYLIADRERVTRVLGEGNRGVAARPEHNVLDFTAWIAGGVELLPTPSGLAPWLDQLGLVMAASSTIAVALALAGVAIGLAASLLRRTGWRRHALILAWTVLPLGLVAWQSSTVYLHYLVFLFPSLFLLMAVPLGWLFGGGLGRRLAGVALLLAVALPQLATWLALQRTLTIYDTNPAVEPTVAESRLIAELARKSDQTIGTGEQYGVETPVRYWLAAVEAARRGLAETGGELLVATEGTDPLSQERPAILEATLGPSLDPRYLQADSLALPLGRPALLLVTSDVDLAVSARRLGAERALVPLPSLARGTRDGIRLYDLPARVFEEWVGVVGAERFYPNASLPAVAYDLPDRVRSGETLELISLWRGRDGALFPRVVLVADNGDRLEEQPETRQPANVAADEALLTRHELELPRRAASTYRVLLEPSPDRPGEAIELGRVSVAAR